MTGRAATPGVIREFVGLPSRTAGRAAAGGHPCQGLYHHSVGRKPKVALIAAHYQIDFSEHYLAEYMAIRGIGFLGWNTRFRGFESSFLLDHALVDIGVGVRWLREVQGVETVVLLGNSGGGSLMAAYQSQAVDPNVTSDGMRPAAGVTELPAADAYVAAAAHPGRRMCSPLGWTPPSLTKMIRLQPIPNLTCSTNATGRRTHRVYQPVSLRAGQTQPHHHRLGRIRTQTCSRSWLF